MILSRWRLHFVISYEFWILMTVILLMVEGHSYESEKRLRTDILDGYHTDIRPMDNLSDAIHINISTMLFSLQEVDQVKGVITVVMVITARWYDQRLFWNPADYDGITKLLILMDQVWTPSITLAYPVELASMGRENTHVAFYSNGSAVFLSGHVLYNSCTFNTQFWPFDKQVCDIGFYPLDYTKNEVQFHITAPGIDTTFYTPNSQWTLDDISYFIDESYDFSGAVFRLKLSRQSLFFVITTVLPVVGIGSLACLVFLLPSESGERVSFVVTILLAMAVFLTIVEDDLPKSSDPVSLVCILLLFGVLLDCLICILVIINLSIYHRDEKVPKSQWHTSIVKFMNYKREHRDKQDSEMTENEEMETKISHAEGKECDAGDVSWPHVGRAIDRILLFVCAVMLYLPSPCLLLYLKIASDYPKQ